MELGIKQRLAKGEYIHAVLLKLLSENSNLGTLL